MEYSSEELIKSITKQVASHAIGDHHLANKVIAALKDGKIRVRAVEDKKGISNKITEGFFDGANNTDIDEFTLKRLEKLYCDQIKLSGIYGAVSEYWNGRYFCDCMFENCLSGFVGSEFIGSGKEFNILVEALSYYEMQVLDDDGFVVDPYKLVQAN
jgi:hypothetical protein